MNTYEVTKKQYLEALKQVNIEYDNYKQANLQRIGVMNFTVDPQEPINFYMAVSDLLHFASIIHEKEIKSKKIKGKDNSFFSAIRFVDNIRKHEEQEIEVWSLMGTATKLMGNGSNKNGVFSFTPKVEIVNVWNEIPIKKIKKENLNQKKNYDLYLKGKIIKDTIDELDLLLNKYITFS